MKTNTNIKVAKKYQGMLSEIDYEGRVDGYWAYSAKGFRFAGMGCHTAHEDNQKELLAMIRTLEPCDCKECCEPEPKEKNPHCSCDEDQDTRFFNDHGCCEFCHYVGDEVIEGLEVEKSADQIQPEEENYIIMNAEDTVDWWEGTIKDVRQVVLDNWGKLECDTLETYEALEEHIPTADIDDLDLQNCLEEVGYRVFNSHEEMLEWRREMGMEE